MFMEVPAVAEPAISSEKHAFQAETSALLRLVTNSLYTNREIFLRELISNASDALDKARFEALVDETLRDQAAEPKITLVADHVRGVLVIEDNGIGMTHEEATRNLGTIAHSGTLEYINRAASEAAEGNKPDLNLIGQFGVGFYSAFMVAKQVDVISKSARAGHESVHWSSDGQGEFTLGAGDRETRGTRIEITLDDEGKEFLDRYRIEAIVKRYSNYVQYPIELVVKNTDGKEEEPKRLNAASAFWTRNPKELGDEDYEDFYRHVMGGFLLPGDKPLARLHLSMDAPIQFSAVLFVPGRRPADLFGEESKNLQLFARRVLVMEHCDKLLPVYMRFVRGVVDSEDLPLNVSREMLQEHQSLAAIRRQLTRKVLKQLEEEAKERPESYEKIWNEFGVFLKEGLHIDNAHREQLTELLRFVSTTSDGKLVSLKDYVSSMVEGQEAIYYITGESLEDLRNSPHLEGCRSRNYPVLLMTDPVDEWVVQELSEYEGKPLRSVTQGDLELPSATEGAEDEATPCEGLEPLVEKAKAVLGDRVKDVCASKRLTQSASCLVDAEGGIGRNMERILKLAGRDVHARPRILEINPGHPFVRATAQLACNAPDDERLGTYVELLYDQANLAEGTVPDPAGTVKRIQSVLDTLVELAHK
jgi:molecular chaperone HtpG